MGAASSATAAGGALPLPRLRPTSPPPRASSPPSPSLEIFQEWYATHNARLPAASLELRVDEIALALVAAFGAADGGLCEALFALTRRFLAVLNSAAADSQLGLRAVATYLIRDGDKLSRLNSPESPKFSDKFYS